MERRGQLSAAEREFSLAPKEPSFTQPTDGLRAEKVTKRFWWPHPYAKDRGLLWRNVVVGYHYYDARGQRVLMPWEQPR